MPQPPTHEYLSVVEGVWRVHLCFVNGDGYTAQFEQCRDGQWQPSGPVAASRRSEVWVLARLAQGYHGFAQALERRWSFTERGRLLDGCPNCGYPHIKLSETAGQACWQCIACKEFGSKALW